MDDWLDLDVCEDLSLSDEVKEYNDILTARVSSAHKEALAAYNKTMQQHVGNNAKMIRPPLMIPKLKGTIEVSAEQWKARINALLHMVGREELVLDKLGFKKAWAEVSSSPFARKLREYKFNEEDAEVLLTRLRDKGLNLKLPKQFTPSDIIARLKEKYVLELTTTNKKLKTENELLKKLTKYEFVYDDTNDAIIYKGQVFKYSSKHRKYITKWNNTTIGIPVSSKEKMVKAFDAIDTFLELSED